MEWDTTPPKDLNATAASLVTAASAIKTLTEALAAHNVQLDVAELCAQLGVPTAGAVEEPDADAEAGAVVIGGEAQDTALNGAQVGSLLEVVQSCAAGQIPRDTAIGIIKRAFLVDDAQAAELLGSVGAGFVPTSTEPTAAPVAEPEPMQEAA
jgi:hypothetical protein